ncbi:hypothetical protein T4C_13081 [Trichinella pseudospiralis]|uniref:Uncharacterized protein n=1 Tax=Trichinella pseudospiralis TaxID=6337 RepID=A0A0V1JVS3_TRIPS|nr:hypothetical protein T4C_13081 [Trichinella pseudospiralis]
MSPGTFCKVTIYQHFESTIISRDDSGMFPDGNIRHFRDQNNFVHIILIYNGFCPIAALNY